jgi:hypothetical protein
LPDLPLILAGPILRRVEPTLVCVWVALSEAKSIRLQVFTGREQAGLEPGVYTGGAERERMRAGANTVRVGANLHVGIVYTEFLPEQPLLPATNYSYNLAFGPFIELDGGFTRSQGARFSGETVHPTADLRSEKLLRNAPIDGRPHLALGYTEGELPGFSLPPLNLTDLRILHGSCRRPGYVYPEADGKTTFDGLAWIDDLIVSWRRGTAEELPLDPNVRPHQLFLTGDQIYADDVSTPLLPMLNRMAVELMGQAEVVETRYPPDADDQGREQFLGAKPPKGFPTLQELVTQTRSQDPNSKDPLAFPLDKLKEDRKIRVLNDPCFDRAFKLLYTEPFVLERPDTSGGLRSWPVDLRHFPAALRGPVMDCEARFTSPEGTHLISLGEYCAMYLAVSSNAAWHLSGGKPVLADINAIFPENPLMLLDLEPDFPQLWELHTGIPRVNTTKGRALLVQDFAKKRADPNRIRGFTNALDTLTTFYGALPRVRRALANVPTYMIFDDHDVTDDWNLSRAWRDRVFTAPLGRRVLMNAILAYALFQDWGNDPKRYERGDFRELLLLASRFARDGALEIPEREVTDELEKLFAFNQPDPEQPAPKLKWHFSVGGPRHRVVALDTRNRRLFRSRYLPPALLSPQGLKDQLPDPTEQPLPAGVEVLLVLSQTPALMPSISTSLIVPLMGRLNDMDNHTKWRNLTGLEPDNELWPGDDVGYEDFIRRLADYRRVVVLSGEIHYGFAGQMSYWKQGLKRLALAAALEQTLNDEVVSPALRTAFAGAGFTLTTQTCVVRRDGNDEWVVIDPGSRKMFLVRKESDGLNVYEEDPPARIAQFGSSGLKNAKDIIIALGRGLGYAFTVIDLTPAERLIWKDATPVAVTPPEGRRFSPAIRDRLGNEPVLLPSRNWPAGTKIGRRRPDFTWRLDLVRDERPEAERQEFTRAEPPPAFDAEDVEGFYRKIADRHRNQLDKVRFARGVLYQPNLGLVRFERDGGRLIARQDLYSNPPERDEAVVINTYRVPLDVFGEERPRLAFDLPKEDT